MITRFLKHETWQGTEPSSSAPASSCRTSEGRLRAEAEGLEARRRGSEPEGGGGAPDRDAQGGNRRRRARQTGAAPLIGVGHPGLIREDGAFEEGGQNLPGSKWESDRFNLPKLIRSTISTV